MTRTFYYCTNNRMPYLSFTRQLNSHRIICQGCNIYTFMFCFLGNKLIWRFAEIKLDVGNIYGKKVEILASTMIFLFLTSAFSYFLCLYLFTKCLIRKIATEYFRSEERKRIKGLKEAIHECGGKVMPLFNFSMANDSNFFICHFTLMSPR